MTEARLICGWRQWAAHLALLLIVFAVIQPALAAPAGASALRYMDVSFKADSGGDARHDHDHTLCHSCAGHVCLEQPWQFRPAADFAPCPAIKFRNPDCPGAGRSLAASGNCAASMAHRASLSTARTSLFCIKTCKPGARCRAFFQAIIHKCSGPVSS